MPHFFLEGSAHHWWMSVEAHYLGHGTITWSDFRKEFNNYFFCTVYQDDRRSEFLMLEQGSMTVEEYEKNL